MMQLSNPVQKPGVQIEGECYPRYMPRIAEECFPDQAMAVQCADGPVQHAVRASASAHGKRGSYSGAEFVGSAG